jgi:hypothetical protein
MSVRILPILLIICISIPAGCLKKKQISGKEFIPREVLVDVLVDIHLVDGVTNDRKFFRRYENVDSIDVLGPILDKYNISRQMFDTTIYEYSRYPLLFDQVYNEVLMKLNIMLDENDQSEDPNRLAE